MRRIAVGAVTLFVALSLLYGLNNAFMVIAMLTICTLGIALLPMGFAAWLTGWLVLSIWEAVWNGPGDPGPAAPRNASGR